MTVEEQKPMYDVLDVLIGQPLDGAMKIREFCDLYVLGFGDEIEFKLNEYHTHRGNIYDIHLTSAIKVYWEDGRVEEYDWDTAHSEFDEAIKPLVGQRICKIGLSDKNDLWLVFGKTRVVIITKEDGEESWRFLKREMDASQYLIDSPQLVVTDIGFSIG